MKIAEEKNSVVDIIKRDDVRSLQIWIQQIKFPLRGIHIWVAKNKNGKKCLPIIIDHLLHKQIMNEREMSYLVKFCIEEGENFAEILDMLKKQTGTKFRLIEEDIEELMRTFYYRDFNKKYLVFQWSGCTDKEDFMNKYKEYWYFTKYFGILFFVHKNKILIKWRAMCVCFFCKK